ncbi:polyprenyl synthetase family protein [Microvirga tunisiensis]|uniref:Octaprenyl diphosphate synthase n=3 Tax=Pannonibacter tanglangensis TaxID=2750084 RepID=A0A7X5F002_9HYPH|nr:polyprenyl synthetase family protein [Pannonibacter sp. XCT-34]NBN77246.1 polyprenyl synthetase family protein [Pannonibacter sp. XCT-53]
MNAPLPRTAEVPIVRPNQTPLGELHLAALVASAAEKSQAQPGIQLLMDLVAADMQKVNELILSKAGSNVELIPIIAKHLIDSGGKRLRPMLTLALADMFGYAGNGHVILAASVEFMHTATLLHDDVVDESDMRRGKLAARKLWGNQASVLVGDYLLGQAFKMMVDVGSLEALRILAEASAIIAEGEVMQLGAAKNIETSEAAYLKVIEAKTAALFAAASEVGPVISGQSPEICAAARRYGMDLGLAFQLVDDALDYGGSSADLGKQVGDDFREGKITLPIVVALERGSDEDRAFWKRCLEQGDIRDGDLDHAIALLRRLGAIDETIRRARHYGASAIAALEALPDTPHRQALRDAVEFCIARVS